MKRQTKLIALLAVLIVICLAAFLASRHEEQLEQIRNSDAVILEIPTDSLTALSWTGEDGTLSLHRENGSWFYDDDPAFPVDDAIVDGMAEQFASFGVAFEITDVTDTAQYGLDDPACTITLTTADGTTTVQLGTFSTMDSQRYVSIGDGKVYLVSHDPYDEFDAVLSDLILQDTVPNFGTVTGLQADGDSALNITRQEGSPDTYCEDDVFFLQQDSGLLPLDTSLVDSLANTIRNLSLTDYASYNVSQEELDTFGLTSPERTFTVKYTPEEDAAEETFVLHVSRDPAKLQEAIDNAEDGEEPADVEGYVRVGDSQIVYNVNASTCATLLNAAPDTLRHKEMFPGSFDAVSQIDVTLEGSQFTFTADPGEEEGEADTTVWHFNGAEVSVSSLESTIASLTATEFTAEQPTGKEEIALTIHQDNENFPEVSIVLYRLDGTSCTAVVDGTPFALVSRSSVVDLIEAVNALIL